MARLSRKAVDEEEEKEWEYADVGGRSEEGKKKTGEQVDRRALGRWKRNLLFFQSRHW